MAVSSPVDDINRPIWSKFAHEFGRSDTWTDIGERAAVQSVADRVRNLPILDIGVGAGRSSWLLRLLSEDYVAIDYTAEMVALCRRNLPSVDVRQMDARDLHGFADNRFGLVVFSFNGIDAIDHEGRQRALREMQRVLRPGGTLLFSTLNKDGPSYNIAPWQVRRGDGIQHPWWVRTGRFAATLPLNLPRYARSYRNWWRNRRPDDHGEWAIASFGAHDFALVVHYNTLNEQRRELGAAGFTLETIWTDTGAPVDPETGTSTAPWHHFVATRR